MIEHIYSSDYLAELEPYFRLEMVHGRGNSLTKQALPIPWAKQIKSLRIREQEGKRDTLVVVLGDLDMAFYDKGIFDMNQRWVVYAGYRSRHEIRGPFVIANVETQLDGVAGATVTVTGYGGGKLGRKVSRRVVSSGTLRDLFKRVAKDNGLEFVEEGTEDLDIPIDEDNPVVQTGESDGRFLTRVAHQFGWKLTTTGEKIHLTPKWWRRSLGIIVLDYQKADSSISNMKIRYSKPRTSWIPVAEARRRRKQIDQARAAGLYYQQRPDGSWVRIHGAMEDARTGALIQEDPVATPAEWARIKARAKAEAAGYPMHRYDHLSDRYDPSTDIDTIEYTQESHEAARGVRTPEGAGLVKYGTKRLLSDGGVWESAGGESFEFHVRERKDADGNTTGYEPALLVRPDSPMNPYNKDPALAKKAKERQFRRKTKIVNGVPVEYIDKEEPPEQATAPDMDPGEGGRYATSAYARKDEHKPKKKAVKRRRFYKGSKILGASMTLKLGSMAFRPQHQVQLIGLGKKFSGPYRVTQCEQSFEVGSAFKTQLVLKRGWLPPPKKLSDAEKAERSRQKALRDAEKSVRVLITEDEVRVASGEFGGTNRGLQERALDPAKRTQEEIRRAQRGEARHYFEQGYYTAGGYEYRVKIEQRGAVAETDQDYWAGVQAYRKDSYPETDAEISRLKSEMDTTGKEAQRLLLASNSATGRERERLLDEYATTIKKFTGARYRAETLETRAWGRAREDFLRYNPTYQGSDGESANAAAKREFRQRARESGLTQDQIEYIESNRDDIGSSRDEEVIYPDVPGSEEAEGGQVTVVKGKAKRVE